MMTQTTMRQAAASVARMAGQTLGVLAWVLLPAIAAAASPTPSRPISADTRSALEAPGIVGSPGLAILAVVAIAVGAIAVTSLYLRLTAGRRQPTDRP